MRQTLLPARGVLLLLLLLAANGWSAPVELSRQSITLPANPGTRLFADVDGDRRSDLLVMDPVAKRLLNYHQRPAGFTNAPDQTLPLPPQTSWVALSDVDAHPGLELLISTATGLLYSRQNDGRFEAERRTLIEASQVFTNTDFPILISLSTNNAGTNDSIPVISARQIVQYRRNSAYEWIPGPALPLDVKQTTWLANPSPWTLGPNRAHSLRAQQSFRAIPDQPPDQEPDSEAIRKIIEGMEGAATQSSPRTNHVDVDGDGRQDLVLWQISEKLDVKTDIYIFRRGADQQLPGRPTDILHCRGFPIPFGTAEAMLSVNDLNGDGICELVLLEPRIAFTSPSGLLEMALSRGLDWSLTVRSFQRGAFSRSPDASVPITTTLPFEDLDQWLVFLPGDFNGDGRTDILTRRSETQWNIFFSTTDGRWFAPQPALVFNASPRGYFELKDLNSDGAADIIWHETMEPRLSIFRSPAPPGKGRNP